MGSVNIYDSGKDTTYKVSFEIKSTLLNNDIGDATVGTGEVDFYLDISTTMKKVDGTAFGHFIVRSYDDMPPGIAGPATDFTDMCEQYIQYFIDTAELIASSSSSSSYGYTSSSSSSSSYGMTSSSSSSSSYGITSSSSSSSQSQ